MTPRTRNRFTLALVIGALFIVALAVFGPARSHDHWINAGGYRGPDGTRCCGEGDCFPLEDNAVAATPVGWQIKDTGEVIPYAEALVSEDTHFWRCKRYDGSRRCFFAPGAGS